MSSNSSLQLKSTSDIFYIPQRLFKAYSLVASIFRSSEFFIEFAVPVLVNGLDRKENIEYANFMYNSDREPFSYNLTYAKVQNAVHPAKLSLVESDRKNREEFCNFFVKDKTSEFLQ